jgi:hypothetical protein
VVLYMSMFESLNDLWMRKCSIFQHQTLKTQFSLYISIDHHISGSAVELFFYYYFVPLSVPTMGAPHPKHSTKRPPTSNLLNLYQQQIGNIFCRWARWEIRKEVLAGNPPVNDSPASPWNTPWTSQRHILHVHYTQVRNNFVLVSTSTYVVCFV